MKNWLFPLGAVCMQAANLPALYGALVHNQHAPLGFLCLIQFGLMFYLIDAIVNNRPLSFKIAGIISITLNGTIIALSVLR